MILVVLRNEKKFLKELRCKGWLPSIVGFCDAASVEIRRQLERSIRDVGADERSLSI